MADITLSNAVRNNLLSLQNTAELLGKTQEKLSTGLKVNSALDDPTAFFTASSLNSRASDLSRLLDSVGNAVQTVRAADEGITSITKLVEAAQATARQALQKPGPSSPAVAAVATGSVTIAADTGGVSTGSVTIAADAAATSASSTGGGIDGTEALDDAEIGLTNTDTLTITSSDGSFSAVSIDFSGTGGETTGATLDISGAADVDDLIAEINSQAGSSIASLVSGEIQIQAVNNTSGITFGGTAAAATLGLSDSSFTNSQLAGFSGTISVTVGSGSAQTIDLSSINVRGDLTSALSGLTGVTANINGSNQVEISATGADALTISGAGATEVGLSSSAVTNSQLAGFTGSLSVTVGSGSAQTIDLSTVNVRADLTSALSGLTGVSASINGSDNVEITASDTTSDIAFSSSAGATELGLSDASATTGTAVNNADRAALETEFNNLRTQIDQLAADASFNGVNLLNGDSLSVIFNEDGSSSLAIAGVTFDSSGLSISAAATDSFQSNTSVNASLTELDSAIGTLRQQASTFGSNLSVVEVRQDFTKNLINTLETGAANLTLADTNEEGANLLALQTRQQLSSVALSLASQSDQNVLRLF